jgi:tryptophanyl-tRNA synthetase
VARRKRVLSGMRPTGRLHIGNYFGALSNWLELQEAQDKYECFFFLADWHALTSDYADTSQIAENTLQLAVDWLAAGLDPKRVTVFQQSQVKEHAELHLLLSMVTPLGWLERVPTYKEQLENIRDRDLHTYGFLGYPVLQAADIVMYGQRDTDLVVPVGEDQVAHVELTREIVRRFNFFYGFGLDQAVFGTGNEVALETLKRKFLSAIEAAPPSGAVFGINEDFLRGMLIEERARQEALETGVENFRRSLGEAGKFFHSTSILREPHAMLTQTPRILGTDGRKMSKSYGNFVSLSESNDDIREKTHMMMTDPARKRRQDPGNPDVCPVFSWHKLFSPAETIAWSDQGCRTAGIGCIECKAAMADNLIRWIEPIRARRQKYEADPEVVSKILAAGSEKAKGVAVETMARVRDAVFHWDKKRAELSQPAGGGLV